MQGTLVDTNVWVAAFFEEHEFFSSANSFITSRTAGEPALFCRATEQSWLRLITTCRLAIREMNHFPAKRYIRL